MVGVIGSEREGWLDVEVRARVADVIEQWVVETGAEVPCFTLTDYPLERLVARFDAYQGHLWTMYFGGIELIASGRRWRVKIGRRTAERYGRVIADLEGWRSRRRTRSLYDFDPRDVETGLSALDEARFKSGLRRLNGVVFLEALKAAEMLRIEMAGLNRARSHSRRVGILWVASRDEVSAIEALISSEKLSLL